MAGFQFEATETNSSLELVELEFNASNVGIGSFARRNRPIAKCTRLIACDEWVNDHKLGKVGCELYGSTNETTATSVELFNQIADRLRILWSIISAMQIRDSLHCWSHCASLFSSLLAIINEWIRDLEF